MIIDEYISVSFISSCEKKSAWPWIVSWRGKKYTVIKVGLHYKVHEGRTLVHYYVVETESASMKIRLDTESLGWKLLEIDS